MKLAEEQGAIGVILYNDPFDYAPSKYTNATYEDTFPNSPYLPPSGAQRGSIAGYPKGDALTPLFPAKGGQKYNLLSVCDVYLTIQDGQGLAECQCNKIVGRNESLKPHEPE